MRISVTRISSINSKYGISKEMNRFCRVNKQDKSKVESLFALYIAQVIRIRIQTSVAFQKINGIPMRKLYKPLSKPYKRKKPISTKNKFYRNTDWLINNIKVYRYNHQYYVGFSKRLNHPSGAKAQDILIWNEKGTKYIPARPLVLPQLKWVATHLKDYWKNFEERVYGLLK